MEMWILLGLASSLAFGSMAIFDRYFLGRERKGTHPTAFAVMTSLTSAIIATPFLFFSNAPLVFSKQLLFFVLGIAFLSTFSRYMYYFALRNGEASYITPFTKTLTLFSVVAGFLFLGEPLSSQLVLGAFFIFLGGYFVLEKQGSSWFYIPRLDLPVILTLGYCILVAFRSVIDTFAVKSYPFVLVMVLARYTNFLTDSLVAISLKKEHLITFVRHLRDTKKTLAIFILRSAASVTAFFLFYASLSTGMLSKVMPLANIDTVVVALFAVLFLGEKMSKQRAVGTILTLIGALLVTMG